MPKVKARSEAKSLAKKQQSEKSGDDRPVLYMKPAMKICHGDTAMTVAQAKKMLGWEAETADVKFGSEYLVKDRNGLKIRCSNNVTNRPLCPSVVDTLKQEHLRKRWQFNGEPIIVGRTGLLLNGQHTLISLVFAAQEWSAAPENYPEWISEPVMEKSIVFGVSEDDLTVNTMDTCKPRTLADVFFRSAIFADTPKKDRVTVARIGDYSIRLLWHRTGASLNAFAPRRTHAESMAFIERHPRIVECVKHIFEENGSENQIGRYVAPGYAAALLYLMAASSSDAKAYRSSLREDSLDFGQWEKACDFWVLLAGNAPEMEAVRKSLGHMIEDGSASNKERWALIVKAWNAYASGQPIDAKSLKLLYSTKDEVRTLAECPAVGGIDMGDPKESDEEQIDADDPSEEEIEERAAAVRQSGSVEDAAEDEDGAEEDEQPAATKPKAKKLKKRSKIRKAGAFELNELVWVRASDGNHWRGYIAEVLGKNARLKVANGFQGAGNLVAAAVTSLSRTQPIAA